MNTPTGPRADEPIDGQVRNLLWRLRARMVIPPSEQRVQADLDRLLAAAQERAHTSASAGASARPTPDGAPAYTPDHPVVVADQDATGAAPDTGVAAEVASIDTARTRRSRLSASAVGRVAAAMIVLAVASGLAGAREGVVTLQTLLGRGESPVTTPIEGGTGVPPLAVQEGPETSESEPPATGDDADDGDAGSAPADTSDVPTPRTSTDEPSDDHRDEPAVASSDEQDDATSSGANGPADGASRSGQPDTTSSDTTSADESSTDGSTDDTDEDDSDEGDTDDGDEDPPPAEDVDTPVIAAPEPTADVDGFGGPRDCEDVQVEGCLPEGETDASEGDSTTADGADEDGSNAGSDGADAEESPSGDDATGDDAAGDDAAGDGTSSTDGGNTATDAEARRDALAERRFQSSSTPTPPAEAPSVE